MMALGNPHDPCEHEKEAGETFAISDNRGHTYRLTLCENSLIWSVKAFDGQAHVAYANCQNQGETLFIADLRVNDAATHPIQGLALLKLWLRRPTRGRVENYRNRGLGSAMLNFVKDKARKRGFLRVTGNLAHIDLKDNPRLPDWYRRRGFRVTMASDQLSGTIETDLP